jgi:hypothetical protein
VLREVPGSRQLTRERQLPRGGVVLVPILDFEKKSWKAEIPLFKPTDPYRTLIVLKRGIARWKALEKRGIMG